MGNNVADDVIDLTSSFTQPSLSSPESVPQVIIDLVGDDSAEQPAVPKKTKKRSKIYNLTVTIPKNISASKENQGKRAKKFGECPICWGRLGKSPAAATKCGHLFCITCLEAALNIQKRCPSCRHVLKAKHSYHPIYF